MKSTISNQLSGPPGSECGHESYVHVLVNNKYPNTTLDAAVARSSLADYIMDTVR